MYQDSKCICTAIVLLIKPFVWWRSRCRRRRGLTKLHFFTRRLCHKSRPLIFYIPCFTEKSVTLLYILNWKEYSFRITSYYRMYWINRTAVWFWAYARSWPTFIEGCAFLLYRSWKRGQSLRRKISKTLTSMLISRQPAELPKCS